MTDSVPPCEKAILPLSDAEDRIRVQAQYDEVYFDGGESSPGYFSYSDSWIWGAISEVMAYLLNSSSYLDWGCAKGYLVQRFVERGIDASGIDVSKYAIQNATLWVRDHRLWTFNGIQTPFGDNLFDTVCSFETLEHVRESDVFEILKEMRRISRRYFFGSIFLQGQHSNDPTHITVKTREWWDARFAEHGFVVAEALLKVAQRFPVFEAFGVQVFCYKRIADWVYPVSEAEAPDPEGSSDFEELKAA